MLRDKSESVLMMEGVSSIFPGLPALRDIWDIHDHNDLISFEEKVRIDFIAGSHFCKGGKNVLIQVPAN